MGGFQEVKQVCLCLRVCVCMCVLVCVYVCVEFVLVLQVFPPLSERHYRSDSVCCC
jgi:hypothetical protein